MKKRMITGLLASVMAIILTVPAGGIKAEAKAFEELNPLYTMCLSAEESQQLKNAASEIVSNMPGSAHEKVKYFHDEIRKRTTYKLDIDSKSAGAFGALVKGKTKCTGYTNALSLLCELADIPCYEVTGYGSGTYHVWNIVQLEDGEWYEVDVTWDDETNSYNWFLLTTKDMNRDHKRSTAEKGINGNAYNPNEGVPVANGTLYAYNKKPVTAGNAKFTITDTDTAEYYAPKKSSGSSVTIPETINIGNKTYKVTSIAKDAFKGNKKLRKVVIGKSIKTIGRGAFNGCKNLSKVTIKADNLEKVGKKAFKGTSKKMTVKTQSDKRKTYKQMLKKAGISSKTKYK